MRSETMFIRMMILGFLITTVVNAYPNEAFRELDRVDLAVENEALMIETGKFHHRVADNLVPWAGTWWPQKSGWLIIGWNDADVTPSYRFRASEIKESDLERGHIKVSIIEKFMESLDPTQRWANPRTSRDIREVNQYSPFDKYGLYAYHQFGSQHPLIVSAWELISHYTPQGDSWWGHCNGWAAAAIMTREPKDSLTVPMNRDNQKPRVTFQAADLKGLLSESYYGVYAHFYGTRFDGAGHEPQGVDEEGDRYEDLTADTFHKLISHYIGKKREALVFDVSAGAEVWNFPAYEYETIIENTAERRYLVITLLKYADDAVPADYISDDSGEGEHFFRLYVYALNTDKRGKVVSGEWLNGLDYVDRFAGTPLSRLAKDNRLDHPDFAWIPYANEDQENPFVKFKELKTLWANDPDFFRREGE